MTEGLEPHPLSQVMLHPWGTDDGMSHLGTLGLQKGELCALYLVLPLRHLSSNLPGEAFDIFTGKG
jgi:hypothetical protein